MYLNDEEFSDISHSQSHIFIPFHTHPYLYLGWEKYNFFNTAIKNILETEKFKKIHHYIFEIVAIEDFFVWGFYFEEMDQNKKLKLSEELYKKIKYAMSFTPELEELDLFNKDDLISEMSKYCLNLNNKIQFDIEFNRFYYSLVINAKKPLNKNQDRPREKSYKKENFNLESLTPNIEASEFINLIENYIHTKSIDDFIYKVAPDGFHGSKYLENKTLKEELIPIYYLIKKIKYFPTSSILEFGFKGATYDAKVTNTETNEETIIEITTARPEMDHLFFTMFQTNADGMLPLLAMEERTKASDTLPQKIITAINKKHDKGYPEERLLIVNVPSDYIPQLNFRCEKDIVNEILREVSSSVKKGGFKEIKLLFGSDFYSLY